MGMCCEKKDDWVNKCMEYVVEGARPRDVACVLEL